MVESSVTEEEPHEACVDAVSVAVDVDDEDDDVKEDVDSLSVETRLISAPEQLWCSQGQCDRVGSHLGWRVGVFTSLADPGR